MEVGFVFSGVGVGIGEIVGKTDGKTTNEVSSLASRGDSMLAFKTSRVLNMERENKPRLKNKTKI